MKILQIGQKSENRHHCFPTRTHRQIFLSSLITDPTFMSIFWSYGNFCLQRIDQKSENEKYIRLSLPNI